jgi:diaminohydroxyphosphoribosylaminopyrimidine deaminase/5-amino-6-(5-phosphoribosylamino)uracil reductase
MHSSIDRRFMRLALNQARKGLGRSSPNPAVGAVVVKDGRVVGRGYHAKAGTPHAEIHALNDAGDRAKGATVYCTLEPCNHHGRTPPCSQALLKAGVKRVVYGAGDPNPRAMGGGEFLASQGVEVLAGVISRGLQRGAPLFLHPHQPRAGPMCCSRPPPPWTARPRPTPGIPAG